jgi:hypothetical protein
MLLGHVLHVRHRTAVVFEATGNLQEDFGQVGLGRFKAFGWVE